MREDAVTFGKTALLGIVSHPAYEAPPRNKGVIFLNAGGLHRVGPSRLYVNLARKLAESGLLALRFDFAGFGDSDPRGDDIPFTKGAVADVRSAMDFLNATRGIEQFVLMGICSGAEASLDTACRDSRVTAIALINGHGYDPAPILKCDVSKAELFLRTARFLSAAWPGIVARKWTRGTWGASQTAELTGYAARNLLRAYSSAATTPESAEVLKNLAERGVQVLLVYEGGAPAAEYVRALSGDRDSISCRDNVAIEIMQHADHTFNSVRQQQLLMEKITKWATHSCDRPALQNRFDSVAAS